MTGDPATNVSKYFIPDSVNPIADAGGIVANSGGAKEQEKRYRAPVDLPKLVSAKITQFFPVTVQRFRNKITYKVNNVSTVYYFIFSYSHNRDKFRLNSTAFGLVFRD